MEKGNTGRPSPDHYLSGEMDSINGMYHERRMSQKEMVDSRRWDAVEVQPGKRGGRKIKRGGKGGIKTFKWGKKAESIL